MEFLKLINKSYNYEKFVNSSVFGFTDSEKAIFVAMLKKKIVLFYNNEKSLNVFIEQFKCLNLPFFLLENSFEMPTIQTYSQEKNIEMFQALIGFNQCDFGVLLCGVESALQKFPLIEKISQAILRLKIGQEISISSLSASLVLYGYVKVDRPTNCGEFSIKGDICDIWQFGNLNLHRLDFFSKTLESIKEINYTFEVLQKVDEIKIFSCGNNLNTFENLQNEIEILLSQIKGEKVESELACDFAELVNGLKNNNQSNGSRFIDVLHNKASIFDLFQNCLFVFDEPKILLDSAMNYFLEQQEQIQTFIDAKKLLSVHKKSLLYPKDVFNIDAIKNPKMSFQNIFNGNVLEKNTQNFTSLPHENYLGKREALIKDVKNLLQENYNVFIYAGTQGVANSISEEFSFAKIFSDKLIISNLTFPYSSFFTQEKVAIFGTNNLLGRQKVQTVGKIQFLPRVGDFVVHSHHGVGKCIALERIKLSDFEKDYIVLEYAAGDKLFVPSEQTSLISAFIGGDVAPKLNKLGGTEFFKTKQKVKASIKEMAFSLKELYSVRDRKTGFAFDKDNFMQEEFEEKFEFDPTPDQLLAISAVKSDMESKRIMDRLICGDVGFGKTEVAIRAIFKAVCSNKQVAFLCPTTLLAKQHFLTCQKRFNEFGISIEVMSRFKTKQQQLQILKDLKENKIQVLIGTHRILSKDVEFYDLGLLVVDEEQRFGVAHKEQIKQRKKEIDSLTLSATPIPRTLHMAISGIRDISIIDTPPRARLPISTFVMEFDELVLQNACKKELERGGQVLILFNRINNIYEFANKVSVLVQSARVEVAHGRMESRTLEKTMMRLFDKEIDILVATTLIENGIDLPKANTLFVIDADHLGLSQLYQLRGRVGRSSTQAYAYLTFKGQANEVSMRRLTSLMEYSQLGSGFKIAMRDLEIRGAGDVLGQNQHGNMITVGYDMYQKILAEVMQEMRGEKLANVKEITMEVNTDAFLPNNLVSENEERISIFSKISAISNAFEEKTLKKSLEQTYGKIPKPLQNLISIAHLKNMAQKLFIKKVKIGADHCELIFHGDENPFANQILAWIQKNFAVCSLKKDQTMIINFKSLNKNVIEKLETCQKFCKEVLNWTEN